MKLEFNVIRMANEDVIATSGLCSHIGQDKYTCGSFETNHINVTGGNFSLSDDANQNGYLDSCRGWYSLSSYNTQAAFQDVVSDGGWYYWNGTKFVKCDENCDHTLDK